MGTAKSLQEDSYYTLTPQFWKTLYKAGITNRILKPAEYRILGEKHGIYLTNIVDRNKHIVPKDSLIEPFMLEEGFKTLFEMIGSLKPKRVALAGKNAGAWFVFKIANSPLQKSQSKEHKRIRRTLNYGFLQRWMGMDCYLLTNTQRQWDKQIWLDFWKLCKEDASAFARRIE